MSSRPRPSCGRSEPIRTTILDLVLERAATVNEMAAAIERPKSTVAHHVRCSSTPGCCGSCAPAGPGHRRALLRPYGPGVLRRGRGELRATRRSRGTLTTSISPLWSLSRRIRLNALYCGRSSVTPGFRPSRQPVLGGGNGPGQRLRPPATMGTTAYGFVVGIYPIPDYPVLSRA